jgi:hypothetical protein
MLHINCPSCGCEHIEVFFKINKAPVFSVATIKSKQQALNVPRKDIELGFCNDCGFIFNRLFDTSIDYFTGGYEDQQGFSETFMDYLRLISNDLIEKYDLNEMTIMEIGCGKGDFINLLTKLSKGKGIGIDPAYEEGRQTNPDLFFYKEFYAEKHGKLKVSMILCRHTLEHIHDAFKFVRFIRKSLDNNPDTVVFFEVPQISRILDIQAFWDIYYEHCSYFSAGSLGRLFRAAGFEVLDIRLVYDDQYLLIEAKPIDVLSTITFQLEESVNEQRTRIDKFKINIKKQLNVWRKKLTALKEKGCKVVIWGGGSKSVGFLTNFSDIDAIEYVVDINPHMEGNFIPGIGKSYKPPSFLKDYQPDAVIIMNGIYLKEITQSLHDMEVYPEILVL